jgi:aldehyde dehydrogenase (NAD+)
MVLAASGDDRVRPRPVARLPRPADGWLGGTVWTSDTDHGTEVARRIQTGTIGVNQYLPDPAASFGGVKGSGLGRELGPEGLLAYQQLQSIYLECLPTPDP